MNHEAVAKLVRELAHNPNKVNTVNETSAGLTAVKKIFVNFPTSNLCLATSLGSKSEYWV